MPNFGCETIGDTIYQIKEVRSGGRYTIPEAGIADSITVYLWIQYDDYPVKCAIYSSDRKTKIGETEERALPAGKRWCTFNFSEPKPELIADTAYFLIVWTGDEKGWIDEYERSGTALQNFQDTEGEYNAFPDDISGDDSYSNVDQSIYCTYEAFALPIIVVGESGIGIEVVSILKPSTIVVGDSGIGIEVVSIVEGENIPKEENVNLAELITGIVSTIILVFYVVTTTLAENAETIAGVLLTGLMIGGILKFGKKSFMDINKMIPRL